MPALIALVAYLVRLQISASGETNLARVDPQKHVEVVSIARVRGLFVSRIQVAMLLRVGVPPSR